jgi:hypothetical protein
LQEHKGDDDDDDDDDEQFDHEGECIPLSAKIV